MANRLPSSASSVTATPLTNILRQWRTWLSVRAKNTGQQLALFYSYLKNLWNNGITGLQKAYLICLVMFYPSELESVVMPLAIVIVVIDFWPKLVNLWDSHSGKLIIIIGYAITMNFVLVNASSLVNEVSGVSANYLPYTHNVAAILLMPEWLLSISLVILVLIQLWLMMSVIYHLFKKDNYANYDNQGKIVRLPFLTALVKTIVVSLLSTQLADTARNNTMTEVTTSTESESDKSNKVVVDRKLALNQFDWRGMKHNSDIRGLQETLLLAFMYYYETDTRSRCQLNDGERAVELNSREILVMKILDDGYNITIARCNSSVFPLKSD